MTYEDTTLYPYHHNHLQPPNHCPLLMKIFGSGSLSLYYHNSKDNLPYILAFCYFYVLVDVLSTHSQDHTIDHYPGSLPPLPKTPTFLRPLPSSCIHAPPPPHCPHLPLTQLGSLAHPCAHLRPGSHYHFTPLSICHICLTKFQLCLN